MRCALHVRHSMSEEVLFTCRVCHSSSTFFIRLYPRVFDLLLLLFTLIAYHYHLPVIPPSLCNRRSAEPHHEVWVPFHEMRDDVTIDEHASHPPDRVFRLSRHTYNTLYRVARKPSARDLSLSLFAKCFFCLHFGWWFFFV
jgi:hypothetical protein